MKGSWNLNGAFDQNVGGSNITIDYLRMNNSAEVILLTDLIIDNALIFATGKIRLGDNGLTLNSGIALSGESASAFVITDGTGLLARKNVGATNVIFPVGPDASNYNPVTINNSGTADDFSVRAKSSFDNPPSDATRVVNVAFDINDSGGGTNSTVTIQWNSGQEAGSFDRSDNLHIGRYTGTAWEPTTATLGGADPYTATASGFTDFSEFGVGSQGALPIELLGFKAELFVKSINLNWQTATEINNSHFFVEKSFDGSNFKTIAEITGAGTSFETNNYQFSDENPQEGINYYRLTDVSFDGEENHSKVLSVNFSGRKEINLSPNPANDFLNLEFDSNEEEFGSVEIFNSIGKLLIVNDFVF